MVLMSIFLLLAALYAFWQVAFWAHLIVILFISSNIARVKNDGWTLLLIPVSVFHHFVLDVSGFVITFGLYLDLYIKFFDTMNRYDKSIFCKEAQEKTRSSWTTIAGISNWEHRIVK